MICSATFERNVPSAEHARVIISTEPMQAGSQASAFPCRMKSYALVALGIALLAAAPLSYPGPLRTHAGFGPLYALQGDAYAAQSMGALPLILSRALVRAGIAPVDAVKSVIGLSFLLGAIGAFLLGARVHSGAGGLVASAVYSLLPYRLMTAYVRGDPGESLFFGLFPLVLVAGAILLARVTLPCFLKSRGLSVAALGPAVLLAAVVLWKLCVPFAPDASQAEAHLYQIFSAQWGYGGGTGWLESVPLQIGVAPVGLGVIALVSRFRRSAVVLAACAIAASVLSIVPFSGWWPWSWLFNEPWSLLGLAGMCLALLAARLVESGERETCISLVAAIVTFVVLAGYPYLVVQGTGYAPSHLPLARYDASIYVVDADVPALQPGSAVTVTLLWQDIAPIAGDYKVFVHAIDAQDKVWAQRDAEPLDNTRPTHTWRRGELLSDPYALLIPNDAPAGLVVETGLYRADNGERLRTATGDDRLVIAPRAP
jgi:hypothetical protein